jgi:large subunit ribosomal protein L18
MKTAEYKQNQKRLRRALRVRKKLRGTSLKPRLCVVKSNQHIEVQLIDDVKGVTIASTSTRAKDLKTTEFNRSNKQSARKLGEIIADLATKQNIKEVIFDRGPHKYHGILQELADTARGAGLKF